MNVGAGRLRLTAMLRYHIHRHNTTVSHLPVNVVLFVGEVSSAEGEKQKEVEKKAIPSMSKG